MAAVGRASQRTDSSVVVKDNRVVEVYTLDAEGLKETLDGAGEVLSNKVTVEEVEELAASESTVRR